MLTGREKEQKTLENILNDKQPHFLAVYGRRRVGKTFLIRKFFAKHNVPILEITGTKNQTKEVQIDKFIDKLEEFFKIDSRLERPPHWRGVFKLLSLKIKKAKKPLVVFIDEISWLASGQNELISEIDYFWNTEWSKINNFKLILCGSATAWILEKIINDTGGLHNRLTARIHLAPFTLSETKKYLHSRNVLMDKRQILDLYMMLGGVPYYLNFAERGESPYETVNRVCFSQKGDLRDEPTFVIEALYKNFELHKQILDTLSAKRYGMNKKEIEKATTISAAGTLTSYLRELLECNFISEYTLYKRKKRESYYRVSDEFLLFAEKFMKRRKNYNINDSFLKLLSSTAFSAWSGYSFENVCHKHCNQLLEALSIGGMQVEASSWDFRAAKTIQEKNFQIDLVLDRADNLVTLCEMKYSKNPFILTKVEAKNVLRRQAIFQLSTKKRVNSILVSASEVVMTPLVKDTFAKVVLAEDLFGE